MHRNLIFDVGLHRGEDTEFYLASGYRVVAFEANADLVRENTKRFAKAIDEERLVIVEGAIAPAAMGDTITFYKSDLSIWGTTEAAWDQRNRAMGVKSTEITVARVDMPEIFRKHGMPYYMKVDIEGQDFFVVSTLREFEDRPLYVSIESDKRSFETLESEINLLKELGYTKFKAVQQKRLWPRKRLVTDLNGGSFAFTFPGESSGPLSEDLEQPWLNARQIIEEYKRIFKLYELVGDHAPIRAQGQSKFLNELELALDMALPGWFDTHATR